MNDDDLTYNKNANPCKRCEGGLVFFVMAGETAAHARPCRFHHVAPYGYCVIDTAPCPNCEAGVRVATAKRKLSAKEGAIPVAPNLQNERFRCFVADYCFPKSIQAADFARICNQLRHKQNLAAGRTESGLQDAKTGKPITVSAPISNAVDEAFAAMKRQYGMA